MTHGVSRRSTVISFQPVSRHRLPYACQFTQETISSQQPPESRKILKPASSRSWVLLWAMAHGAPPFFCPNRILTILQYRIHHYHGI